MTTTIFAEDLKQGDKIIIPATAQTSKKELMVSNNPGLNDLTVNGFAYPIRNNTVIKNHETPFQFGRKVELEVERNF
jgi:hypothetical protein